jgi:hypothetical protein
MIKTYIRQKWVCDLCGEYVLMPSKSSMTNHDEDIDEVPICWLNMNSFSEDPDAERHNIQLCPTCLLRIERRIALDSNLQKLIDSTKDDICLSPDLIKTRMNRLSMEGKFKDYYHSENDVDNIVDEGVHD